MPFLDVLRALAVIGVVTVHTAGWSLSNLEASDGFLAAAGSLFASGRLGVEVFFFLSGFLLSMLYEGSEKSLTSYTAARFFRIWPLWILFSLGWAGYFYLSGEPPSWIMTGLVLSTFFLLWISPDHFDSFIGGAWSIQIEIVSYIIFWFLRGKGLKVILGTAILINLVGTVMAALAPMDEMGVMSSIRRLSLQTGFNFFVLGWLSSRLAKSSGWLQTSKPNSQGIEKSEFLSDVKSRWPMLTLWVLTFLITPAYFGNPIEAIGFVCLALMLSGLAIRGKRSSQILGYVGRRSYFVFFAHFLILDIVEGVLVSPATPAVALLLTPLAVLLILGLSLVAGEASFRWFERPLMKFARRF